MLHRPDGRRRPAGEIHRILQAERSRCLRNPFHWLRNYVWIQDPKATEPGLRVIPLIPWPGQKRLVRFLLTGYRTSRKRLVNKAREIGATWLAVALIHRLWLSTPRFYALLGSRKEKLVDDRTPASLFGKLRFVHETQPQWLRPEVEDVQMRFVNLENGSSVGGEATNVGFGRSFRAAVVLTDEWAHVERGKQQPIKLSVETVPRTWWKISTPSGRGDEFHTDWLLADPGDKLLLDWRTDPRRSEEWFERLLVENGGNLTWDEREQEHNCSQSPHLHRRHDGQIEERHVPGSEMCNQQRAVVRRHGEAERVLAPRGDGRRDGVRGQVDHGEGVGPALAHDTEPLGSRRPGSAQDSDQEQRGGDQDQAP